MLAVLFMILLSMSMVLAEGKTKDFVIGFANGYFGNSWRSQYIDQATTTANKWKERGVIKDFKIVQVNDDVTKQIVQLNSLIDQGVDCLIINPVSAEALAPVVRRAKQAGVMIINVDDPFAYEGVTSVILDQKVQLGVQARWLFEQLKNKGDVNLVYLSGLAGNTASKIRDDEIMRILKEYPNIHIVGQGDGGWNETKAQQVMSNFISSYPKIDAVLTQDIAPLGEIRAYEIAGKKLPLMNMDYVYGTLRKWASLGIESIAVNDQPTIGSWGIEVAVRLLMGWKVKPGVYQGSPINPAIKSTIIINPNYIVTNAGKLDPICLKDYNINPLTTKTVSLQEALNIGKSESDSGMLDQPLTDAAVDSLFELPPGAKW